VNDINLPGQLFNSAGNDIVVQRECPLAPYKLVRDTHIPTRERRAYLDSSSDRLRQRARKYEHLRSGGREAIDLLPGRVADPVCTQLMGKAVKNAHVSAF